MLKYLKFWNNVIMSFDFFLIVISSRTFNVTVFACHLRFPCISFSQSLETIPRISGYMYANFNFFDKSLKFIFLALRFSLNNIKDSYI